VRTTISLIVLLMLAAACGGGGALKPADLTPGAPDFSFAHWDCYWSEIDANRIGMVGDLTMEDREEGGNMFGVVGDIYHGAQYSDDSERPYRAKVYRGGGGGVLEEYFASAGAAMAWIETEVRQWYSTR